MTEGRPAAPPAAPAPPLAAAPAPPLAAADPDFCCLPAAALPPACFVLLLLLCPTSC